MIKNIKKYIAKYGKHFTEKLAKDVVAVKWSLPEIKKSTRKKVYYNVTDATDGDLLFLVNLARESNCLTFNTKNKCVSYALNIIGNVDNTEMPFNEWLVSLKGTQKSFDFKDYI